jgi:hypothetical protein
VEIVLSRYSAAAAFSPCEREEIGSTQQKQDYGGGFGDGVNLDIGQCPVKRREREHPVPDAGVYRIV